MATNSVIFWHRRDLRVEDNRGLMEAIQSGDTVIPVFIFDTNILSSLDEHDHRVTFIYDSIQTLADAYEQAGNHLEVYVGDPAQLIPEIAQTFQASTVITNRDYEPDALERDSKVEQALKKYEVDFKSVKDHVLFEMHEVTKDDGLPYTVYTPYRNKWMSKLQPEHLAPVPSAANIPPRVSPVKSEMPKLAEIGFSRNEQVVIPDRKIPGAIIRNYHNTRDIPGINGTSRLSVHLRFGTLSIRRLVTFALEVNEKYLNELIWRDFYAMILYHFPKSVNLEFKENYRFIRWENDEALFRAWCEGRTGYPMVDAGMRELNETGFMHNRVRMIAASFLCKHLLIDWRWGERYFAQKLSDFDLSSNVGGWQWAASTGCDAVPYFRIFNPQSQLEKFDPQGTYVNRWIPELGTDAYPAPIVDHAFARNRAIERYKEALNAQT